MHFSVSKEAEKDGDDTEGEAEDSNGHEPALECKMHDRGAGDQQGDAGSDIGEDCAFIGQDGAVNG